jgi:hypothetical protein
MLRPGLVPGGRPQRLKLRNELKRSLRDSDFRNLMWLIESLGVLLGGSGGARGWFSPWPWLIRVYPGLWIVLYFFWNVNRLLPESILLGILLQLPVSGEVWQQASGGIMTRLRLLKPPPTLKERQREPGR